MSIYVTRTATILKPDQSRVLLRPFSPGDPQRVGRIISRLMSLPENLVGPLLDEVSAELSQRHQQIHKLFLERFEQVRELLGTEEARRSAATRPCPRACGVSGMRPAATGAGLVMSRRDASHWKSGGTTPNEKGGRPACQMEWCRKIRTPHGECGCWPGPTTKCSSN